MKKLFLLMSFVFAIFIRIDSVWAVDYPFSLTTTEIGVNGIFQFMLSARGTFYVDCGNGGNLSSDDSTANAMISGGTITKNDTANYTFKCTYSTSGTKTIRFGGEAVEYNTTISVAAISFNITGSNDTTNARLVSSVSGNLSTIFPYLSSNQTPRFYGTFWACIYLQSVPDTLFSGYRGNLVGASNMFTRTFYYTGLKSIPENLFRGITGGGSAMFGETFAWSNGFSTIPNNLFADITISSPYMFHDTFRGDSNLTSIPENLFSSITNGAQGMFLATFSYCGGLTALPKRLFANITTAAPNMFQSTFEDCYNLRGYVPKTLFAGLIANNSPNAADMMTGIFGRSSLNANNLDTTCPTGTTTYTTGYEQYWETGNGTAVSCEPNTINMTFDGANANSCSYGDTFSVPPTPAPRTGMVFTGWKVKTTTP